MISRKGKRESLRIRYMRTAMGKSRNTIGNSGIPGFEWGESVREVQESRILLLGAVGTAVKVRRDTGKLRLQENIAMEEKRLRLL